MSKIGKMPIAIKEGVSITLADNSIKVQGPKGELSFTLPGGINVLQNNSQLIVSQQVENDPITRPLYGLTRSRIANMVEGVSSGFTKKLELSGVGYRALVQGVDLVLSVGFSHPVKMTPSQGISFSVAENIITVSGIDNVSVGDTAARIRKVRPPEPYKGKGISYVGERIRRKAGKAAKAVGAAK